MVGGVSGAFRAVLIRASISASRRSVKYRRDHLHLVEFVAFVNVDVAHRAAARANPANSCLVRRYREIDEMAYPVVVRSAESMLIRRILYFEQQDLFAYTSYIFYTMESFSTIRDTALVGTSVRAGAGRRSVNSPSEAEWLTKLRSKVTPAMAVRLDEKVGCTKPMGSRLGVCT